MITKIICKQCHKTYEYIRPHGSTRSRDFCITCSAQRKYEKIQFSNDHAYRSGKKATGRPRLDGKEIFPECTHTWDEPNFGGY